MQQQWLGTAQKVLRDMRLDGWLVYDFRGSNPVFAQLFGKRLGTTRRVALFIPAGANERPTLVVSFIDAPLFEEFSFTDRSIGVDWKTFFSDIKKLVGSASSRRIAMEYSPGAALPAMSFVDAGTIEAIRALDIDVVSSADLVQTCIATWSADALTDHLAVSKLVEAAKDDAFDFVRTALRNGTTITEYNVQQRISSSFAEYGLDPDHAPIVGVNEHSGDPHFEPTQTNCSVIRPGDWLLIDLWARTPGEANIFSDITWVGFCGRDVPLKHRRVYDVVTAARDACLAAAIDAWNAKQPAQGWQLDDVAMKVIRDAGFGDYIRHRTGHSLSPGPKVHGLGVNIDNLETHDTRYVLPGLGFTIEPGVYLPEFGVRSEINVFMDPVGGPIVTSCIQREIELLI